MIRLAVMTSGGDAPGMNAALRSVVRMARGTGYDIIGIPHGFSGLIAGECRPLGSRDVGGILGLGGTVLGTTRCLALKTTAGLQAAVASLTKHNINGLIVIGGNGSQAGAYALSRLGVPVIGIASTIDNDLPGTDISIGVTSALDVAVEAIDRLRVTAASLRRVFLVEVMGNHSGYLALMAGLASGAEAIMLPEVKFGPEALMHHLHRLYDQGRSHAIVVVAEGAAYNADQIHQFFTSHPGLASFETRVTKLGHVQRGGTPGVFDRLLATRLGAAAIEHITLGRWGNLIGCVNGEIATTELKHVNATEKRLSPEMLNLANALAC
jgi:6-phosphofructokinase 1